MPDPVIVSACLFGLSTRYDGSNILNKELMRQLADRCLVPVCPEQLGGLPTPRPVSCLCGGDGADALCGCASVVNTAGKDVTEQFVRGARATLRVAAALGVKQAYLKARSPSCGKGKVYIGDALCDGNGVTTALLLQEGIEVICVD
jgi:uncharacterized protein YbbK (DUF523 family)